MAHRPPPALLGCRLWCTQEAARAEPLRLALTQAGATVYTEPVLRLTAQTVVLPAAAWDGVVVISPTAAAMWWQEFGAWPACRWMAAVGPSTARALHAYAGPVHYPEGAGDAAALLAHPALAVVAGQKILLITGAPRRLELELGLRARGAVVDVAAVYQRDYLDPSPAHWAQMQPLAGLWVSNSGLIRHWLAQAERSALGADRLKQLQSTHCWATHPNIQATALAAGWSGAEVLSTTVDTALAQLSLWWSHRSASMNP